MSVGRCEMNNFVSHKVETPPERDFPFHQFNLSIIFDPACFTDHHHNHPHWTMHSLLDGSYLRQLVLAPSLSPHDTIHPGIPLSVVLICLFSLCSVLCWMEWNKVTRTHRAEWVSQCSAIFRKRRQLCALHLFCYCFFFATWRCSKEVPQLSTHSSCLRWIEVASSYLHNILLGNSLIAFICRFQVIINKKSPTPHIELHRNNVAVTPLDLSFVTCGDGLNNIFWIRK